MACILPHRVVLLCIAFFYNVQHCRAALLFVSTWSHSCLYHYIASHIVVWCCSACLCKPKTAWGPRHQGQGEPRKVQLLIKHDFPSVFHNWRILFSLSMAHEAPSEPLDSLMRGAPPTQDEKRTALTPDEKHSEPSRQGKPN